MKKVICLIMLVLSLLIVPNVAYAQNNDKSINVIGPGLPVNLRALEYEDYQFVQEHEVVYEYLVTYYLPYRYNVTRDRYDYIFFYKWGINTQHGEYTVQGNSYKLEEVILEEDRTVFHFRFTLLKTTVDDYYSGNVEDILARDSAMYYKIDEEDAYQRGFNAGVKSITDKYTSNVLRWTVPFITLVILTGLYVGYKKEWFYDD